MSCSKFSDDFKRDVVAQITESGYPVRDVAERLVDTEPTDDGCGAANAAHRDLAEKAQGKGSDPFGPGQPIHQYEPGGVP